MGSKLRKLFLALLILPLFSTSLLADPLYIAREYLMAKANRGDKFRTGDEFMIDKMVFNSPCDTVYATVGWRLEPKSNEYEIVYGHTTKFNWGHINLNDKYTKLSNTQKWFKAYLSQGKTATYEDIVKGEGAKLRDSISFNFDKIHDIEAEFFMKQVKTLVNHCSLNPAD